jgi:DNA (cytosine-5)-methyltransferase 1
MPVIGPLMGGDLTRMCASEVDSGHYLVQAITGDITHALNTANNGKHSSEDGTGRGVPVIAVHGTQDPIIGNDIAHALGRNSGQENAIAFHENQRAEITINDTVGALNSGGGKPGQGYLAVQQGMLVRRLMPVECETLQGFPKNHTLIPVRGKPAADGPRYKSIGNSMAVKCMSWIGQRIKSQILLTNQN